MTLQELSEKIAALNERHDKAATDEEKKTIESEIRPLLGKMILAARMGYGPDGEIPE